MDTIEWIRKRLKRAHVRFSRLSERLLESLYLWGFFAIAAVLFAAICLFASFIQWTIFVSYFLR